MSYAVYFDLSICELKSPLAVPTGTLSRWVAHVERVEQVLAIGRDPDRNAWLSCGDAVHPSMHHRDLRQRGGARAVHFWGRTHEVTPVVSRSRFGDGLAWCTIWEISHRPKRFLVRVDSSWLTRDTDGDAFRNHLQINIVEELCVEFGQCCCEDEGLSCDCEWPRIAWDGGESWSVYVFRRRSRFRRRWQRRQRKARRHRISRRGW